MAKSVRMADIAKVMGVSTVTVSKALSGQRVFP
ncbi:MAG: LacI family DNA-binding transcriptional regulator [Eubacterium sp.]|nr:LacI family DNA-binding transcriptional regulator [Eubacterium sp.]